MTTESPRPALFSARRCFHVLTLGLAMSCLGGIATPAMSAPLSSKSQITASTPDSKHEIQLADEITRRLRRIGLNFNRGRLQRPYDPAGELC